MKCRTEVVTLCTHFAVSPPHTYNHLGDRRVLTIMKNLMYTDLYLSEAVCMDDLTCIDFSLTNSPCINQDFVATALKVTINVHKHTLTLQ